MGVGAIGTWVDPEAARGLEVPHSVDRQARFLETHLPPLLRTAPVVLVSRWRDARPLQPRRFGLHDAEGAMRPALRVVRGLYTGRQTTFALPTGEAPSTSSHLVLMGWGVLVGMMLLYAQFPTVQRTAQRYFRAHVFYRDTVREGRDVLPGFSAALVAQALCTLGMTVYVVGQQAAAVPRSTWMLELTSGGVGDALATWLGAPWTAAGSVVALTATAGGVWIVLLSGIAQRYGRFSLGQALMLVAWPCWGALIGLLVVLILPTMATASWVIPSVLTGTVAASVAITFRIVRDYAAVTKVPPLVAGALALVSPLGGLMIGGSVVLWCADLPLALLWDVLTYA